MKQVAAGFRWLVGVLSLAPALSLAVCLNGHPSITEEMTASRSVIIAKVTAARDTMADPADPNGITSTIYSVKVLEVLAGRSPSHIRLVSENTSGRFPMEIGRSYIVFVQSSGHELYVDNCGNSGTLPEADGVTSEVRKAHRALGLTSHSRGTGYASPSIQR
jgi:hypothetical protein